MLAEERRRKLLDLLQRTGALSVADASRRLHISRMTVHRDLEMLAAGGHLRKVHGGALPVPRTAILAGGASSFSERKAVSSAAKAAIARHLAPLVAGARTLALDASTTVFALGQTLTPARDNRDMFVFTHGIPLFLELQRRNPGIRIALSGGEPHPRTGSLIGPLAVRSLEGLRFDVAVVSAAGLMLDQGQVYDSTPETVAFKQALLACANQTILALDQAKFNFLAAYPLMSLERFDLLVTENGPVAPQKSRTAGRRGAE